MSTMIQPSWFTRMQRLRVPILSFLVSAALGACAAEGGGPASSQDRKAPASAGRTAEPQPRPPVSRASETAATVDGHQILWDELRPVLAEAAGGTALQEAALDRLLEDELARRRITVSPSDIAAERDLISQTVVREAKATPADAERLLDSVRRSRGLGEVRFANMLKRNAGMRKIVAPEVSVTEEELKQAYDMRHGERYRVRVILVSSQSEATRIREQLTASSDNLSARFAEEAMKVSTDSSAARGGMLEPLSPADPLYPASIRAAARTLDIGQISSVLGADRGFAILLMEQKVPGDGVTFEASSAEIGDEVRSRRERVAMDDLAKRLLRGSQIRAMDRGLDWSLKAATGEAR